MTISPNEIRQRLETSPVYYAGEPAFLLTCSGFTRCVVQHVDVPGNGVDCDNRGQLTVEITEGRGPYRSGEIVSACTISVIPRSHRHVDSLDYKIDGFYRWR
jgi:hypothetical protein